MESFQINSSASQLMAKARELTGINDVDSAAEEPLTLYLHSLNTEAQLNREGAAQMEQRILRVLCNRLRMERDFKQHPEISDQKIVKPVILTGGGRTGSTKLHKMLAASGDFKFLPFWQGYGLSTHSGLRDENVGERIAEADEFTRWFDEHAPAAKLIHQYETFEPEEETLLLEHALCGVFMMAFLFIPSFTQWSAPRYKEKMLYVKRTLQYLQWQHHADDSRPWLLKTPIHFANEHLLAEVFPDAVMVATHRNPLNFLSSSISLIEHYHEAYSDARRVALYGQMLFEGHGMGCAAFLQSRDDHPSMQVLDIGYPEVKKSAMKVAEKIYKYAGMDLPDQARNALREWERQNVQHKLGEHKHSLEYYSLTPKMVNERFKGYMERFGQLF